MKTPNVVDIFMADSGDKGKTKEMQISKKEKELGMQDEMKKPNTIGIRHLQCFLLFLCLTVTYALRVNLSVAIVAMTDKAATNPDFEEFNWGEKTKSLLLSSFFWGYIVTQVPGAMLAQRYGAKWTLFFGLLICSILTVLTPICATWGGWGLVCALRVGEGLCQGFVFPSTHTLLSKWAPVHERGRYTTYTYSGSQFGTVLMLGSSGFIASSVMGWPSIFYISGGVGVLWAILWFFFGASSPAECKYISVEEKEYIESSINKDDEGKRERPPTPWMDIARSMPFWALLIVHCTHNWGFWTLLTEIPSYMKNILGLDIKSNALLSALPYLAMMILSYVFSFFADVLAKYQFVSLTANRKIFNTIGHWIPVISLIGLGYTEDNTTAIVLLTVTVGINSATYSGFQPNHIDLSPNFAGTLMGFTNCAANIMSIIAPLTVGQVVTDASDPMQWRIVFFIAGAFLFTGNLLFIIFGRTDVQPWNSGRQERSRSRRTSVHIEAVESHN